MTTNETQILKLAADTLRCLSADEVQKAKSGHPGVALGLSDVMSVLWLRYLRISSNEPKWADRDRFVLSGGHGSSLLYAALHLAGYDLSIDDLKRFRQFGSRTPGHPEYGIVPGVETTTGPLGQGIANGVGMAIAERMLAERLNPVAGKSIIGHRTWVTCGDGDLEEGISHEAASLAGRLGLNRLVLIYDSNRISIEGRVSIAMCDDTQKRFESYGWNVLTCDGHNYEQIAAALEAAMTEADRPTLVICHTTIGKGAPNKQDTAGCHGAPLGDEELRLLKQGVGFNPDEFFFVPAAVREAFQARKAQMDLQITEWKNELAQAMKNETFVKLWKAHQEDVQPNLETVFPKWDLSKGISTRVASGKVLNAIAPVLPQLVGGSADLAPSNMTYLNDMGDIQPKSFGGRNFHFGVRELGMAGVMNGIAVHGGFRIFGGTFFVFCDYCRPVMRVAALMDIPVIYVLTHDSFYVGEDGPTHEPVEQLASLRAMPNMCVLRPADATETAAAWQVALARKDGPTALLLSRQNLPVIDRTVYPVASEVNKGAYILWQKNPDQDPDGILMASGSEVSLALTVAQADERNLRVVSMPSWDLFERQPTSYREMVLPPSVTKRIAVEAASAFGWERYVGNEGMTLTMQGFGASGPAETLAKYFGFTVENLTQLVNQLFA